MKIIEKRFTKDEYIGFLSRTDLGSQYPKERFDGRIEKLVKNASISLAAVQDGEVIGALLGLTDFAYWLYITDLGVDRDHVRKGIGGALIKKAHELAGGEKDIAIYLIANDKAIPFYKKQGFEMADDVMCLNKIEWTPFTVE